NRHLYAVAQKDEMGGVQAYDIDGDTGDLQLINGQLTQGSPPCHLQVNGSKLVTANYHKGTVELLHINENGGVELLSSVKHEGSGPHKRQEKSHVHFAGQTPDKKYIVVCDLGTDELVTYQIENNELVRV